MGVGSLWCGWWGEWEARGEGRGGKGEAGGFEAFGRVDH